MEIGIYDNHGDKDKVSFKLPRKLKKKLKSYLQKRNQLNKYELKIIWENIKNSYVTNQIHSSLERHF